MSQSIAALMGGIAAVKGGISSAQSGKKKLQDWMKKKNDSGPSNDEPALKVQKEIVQKTSKTVDGLGSAVTELRGVNQRLDKLLNMSKKGGVQSKLFRKGDSTLQKTMMGASVIAGEMDRRQKITSESNLSAIESGDKSQIASRAKSVTIEQQMELHDEIRNDRLRKIEILLGGNTRNEQAIENRIKKKKEKDKGKFAFDAENPDKEGSKSPLPPRDKVASELTKHLKMRKEQDKVNAGNGEGTDEEVIAELKKSNEKSTTFGGIFKRGFASLVDFGKRNWNQEKRKHTLEKKERRLTKIDRQNKDAARLEAQLDIPMNARSPSHKFGASFRGLDTAKKRLQKMQDMKGMFGGGIKGGIKGMLPFIMKIVPAVIAIVGVLTSKAGGFMSGIMDAAGKWWNKGKDSKANMKSLGGKENKASWKKLLKNDKSQMTRTDKSFKAGGKGVKGLNPAKAFTPKMMKTGPSPAVRQAVARPVNAVKSAGSAVAKGGSAVAKGVGMAGRAVAGLAMANPVGAAVLGAAALGAGGYMLWDSMRGTDDAKEAFDAAEEAGLVDHDVIGNSEILNWEGIKKLNSKALDGLIEYDDWSSEDMKKLKQIKETGEIDDKITKKKHEAFKDKRVADRVERKSESVTGRHQMMTDEEGNTSMTKHNFGRAGIKERNAMLATGSRQATRDEVDQLVDDTRDKADNSASELKALEARKAELMKSKNNSGNMLNNDAGIPGGKGNVALQNVTNITNNPTTQVWQKPAQSSGAGHIPAGQNI